MCHVHIFMFKSQLNKECLHKSELKLTSQSNFKWTELKSSNNIITFQKKESRYAANIVNLCALYTFTGLDWIKLKKRQSQE